MRSVTSNPVTPLRRLGLPLGLVLGVLGLAVVVAFGVLLPKATGGDDDAVDLPDTLPGGWTAIDQPPTTSATRSGRRVLRIGRGTSLGIPAGARRVKRAWSNQRIPLPSRGAP